MTRTPHLRHTTSSVTAPLSQDPALCLSPRNLHFMATPLLHTSRSLARDVSSTSTLLFHGPRGPTLRPALSLVTNTLRDLGESTTAANHGDWHFSAQDPFVTPYHSPRSSKQVASPLSPLLSGWASASQILGGTESDVRQSTSHSQPKADPPCERQVDLNNSDPAQTAEDTSVIGLPPTPRQQQQQQQQDETAIWKDAQAPHPHHIAAISPGALDQEQMANHERHQNGVNCVQCTKSRGAPPSSFPHVAMKQIQPPSSTIPEDTGDIRGEEFTASVPRKKCKHCGKTRRAGPSSHSDPIPRRSSRSGLQIPTIKANGVALRPEDEPMSAHPTGQGDVLHVPKLHGSVHAVPVDGPGSESKGPTRTSSISRIIRALSFSRRRSERRIVPMSSAQEEPHHLRSRQGDAATTNGISTLAPARADSPLSFLEQPKEDDAFELNDIRSRPSLHQRQSSWTRSDDYTETVPMVERSRYVRSQSAQVTGKDHLSVPASAEDSTYFGITPDQRPGVTRFKSLRSGVNRTRSQMQRTASQIGRSKSLKRLGSVKRVPQLWYRNDMLFDGSGQEYEHGEHYTY